MPPCIPAVSGVLPGWCFSGMLFSGNSLKSRQRNLKKISVCLNFRNLTTMKTRANKICEILKKIYPNVKTQLRHRNSFELLIATILSAQCTDKQVNAVVRELFRIFPTPGEMAEAHQESIESIIHSTGFFRNKARHIRNCSHVLVEKYNGEVPETMGELLTLPGVGRKTANVVLGAAFGVPAMVVDTHVARISKRLGLTRNTNPAKIETDLMGIIPKKDWNDFSLWLIFLGRSVCKARKPACASCPLSDLCPD